MAAEPQEAAVEGCGPCPEPASRGSETAESSQPPVKAGSLSTPGPEPQELPGGCRAHAQVSTQVTQYGHSRAAHRGPDLTGCRPPPLL